MEILAPAGNIEAARAALDAGADAVYLGMTKFSARDGARNFERDELRDVITYAHLLCAKVYVCLNTLVKDGELADFFEAVRTAYALGADAILIQDLFLGKAVKEAYPEVTLHLSTQAGCCNARGAALAKAYGFSRVVLARETAIEDVAEISKIIETEVFVQGALCACFSGQCYLSSFAGNNSGNRGRCKQPCRKLYKIDRAGYEDYAYALSPSDLSLGHKIEQLKECGVCSLKIEGRMRRSEYVAAAVAYFRALAAGKRADEEFSRLARAYNRGDYTEGLAFGERNFLSRNVQGHIGQAVGTISFVQGKPFCVSGERFCKGDGFKILRDGREAGGARFAREGKGGFFLDCDSRVKAGDTVRVTTDTASNTRALSQKRMRPLSLVLRMNAGRVPEIACGAFEFRGDAPLERAQNAPLSAEQIKENFARVDALPFAVEARVETDGVFMPKSALNALRRAFYGALCAYLAPARTPLPVRDVSAEITPVKGKLTAAITRQPTDADIDIYKTDTALPTGGKRRYLYLPPYFSGADERAYKPLIEACDGIYCDGYYGVSLAKDYHKPLFAGTGFNLTNAVSVAGVRAAGATYFALSKELDAAQQRALSGEGAFALSAGDIKVMDLLFCPFSRTCKTCDVRDTYTLTDEGGRAFSLRRFGKKGACRFELYNCAPLAAYNGMTSALVDLSVSGDKALVGHAFCAEEYLTNATGGHKMRSVL